RWCDAAHEPGSGPRLLPEHAVLGTLLGELLQKVGGMHDVANLRLLEDADWVGWRLAEILPISEEQRLALLQQADPHQRLQQLLLWMDEKRRGAGAALTPGREACTATMGHGRQAAPPIRRPRRTPGGPAMVATVERRYAPAFHPVHALLVGGALSLILGALLSDIAYARPYEIQWINFAAWLNAGGALSLVLASRLPDIAYARTYEIQWINFAAWLNAGGLVLAAIALVCSLFSLAPSRRTRGTVLHCVLWLVAWILAFLNALVHARVAWASMPMGLVLSVLVFAIALVATFFAALPLCMCGML